MPVQNHYYTFYRSMNLMDLDRVKKGALRAGWIVSKTSGWVATPGNLSHARQLDVAGETNHWLKKSLSGEAAFSFWWWHETRVKVVAIVDALTGRIVFLKNAKLLNDNDEEFVL